MSNKQNKWLGYLVPVLAVVLLVRFGAFASTDGNFALFNINMPQATALNVSVTDRGQLASASVNDQQLGGLVHNTQEIFDDGIQTNRGSVMVGLSLSGNVTSTSVPTEKSVAFSSSASSQELCSIQNTSGADRVLDNVVLVYTTSSNTGASAVNFTISQATTAIATGTGATLLYDRSMTLPVTGITNLTSTSTLTGTGGVKQIWKSGNYINFMTALPTSTLSGTCRVISF